MHYLLAVDLLLLRYHCRHGDGPFDSCPWWKVSGENAGTSSQKRCFAYTGTVPNNVSKFRISCLILFLSANNDDGSVGHLQSMAYSYKIMACGLGRRRAPLLVFSSFSDRQQIYNDIIIHNASDELLPTSWCKVALCEILRTAGYSVS